ncbi:pyridine nucleotide-disulfide oxidoreductase/dicluster-binding protein [Sporomusa acidovorans]|uniref:4Fe-4S ferredoxin-type domain-containing protein n=1 Tax=Sporomusa acidovorans (strain ATCC 49682 / DSM 3132 / Mol) TaxID=1123286 RepID=A0ABZ3IZZ6_SPOA4|nr:pyridine nucleotide-disulfide oxidoreductase/dicluster-binding protein [Sporomusa acidovorans]OZC22269.1 NADPH-Fe(3+) oxidoreductase subunit beta [Sporomusa acidovorans DSM 3132]SDF34878.1 aldehyde dehydrogenase, iron-sulfur subunit [Sporomusa acidovorans]
MDQQVLRKREAKCVQDNPPGCTAGCPVHVDVRGMITAIRKGDYDKGYELFHKMVPFPGIISRICAEHCRAGCKRNEIDEPIAINALEKICADKCQNAPKLIIPPLKNQKVAVVGAGLSGLTAVLELSRKGYKVVIFEATGRLGGSIWDIPENRLPRELIRKDFAIFEKLPVEINYNMAIGNRGGSIMSFADLGENFDAVYLGVGCEELNSLDLGLEQDITGRLAIDPVTLATSQAKVFAGGSLRLGCENRSPALSIADGKIAAISIDRFLQGVSLTANRGKEGSYKTSLYTNIAGVKPRPMVTAADPASGYSQEEASQEANRCLACECLECVKACEYLAHYRGYPKKYAREVYNNLSIVMGIHHANKMINSCSLCGLCEQVCPGNLNMGEICQEARQMMVSKGKMPPSAHEFALRDMEFSNSERFVLNRHQPGFTASKMVFFPSCQLAASSPQVIRKIYNFLCEKIDGGVGLMLGCCGAPANWAGQEGLFKKTVQKIERNWRALGSPKVITACPSCFSMFKRNLPDMPVEMIWTVLESIGLPAGTESGMEPQRLAIHDSCTTRHEVELQTSIRNILSKLGHKIEELPHNRDHTTCCGYGGLMIYVNKEVAHKVISKRIKESETDYVTYCAMCRDNFASQGKHVYHLLDMIFSNEQDNLAEREVPGYSQRQENRAHVKTSLLREIWGETVGESQPDVKVTIPKSVRQIMDDRMILVEDVTKVIAYAESTGNRLENPENGHFIVYYQPVAVTYWVEYSPLDDGFVVHNAYSHRIQITN